MEKGGANKMGLLLIEEVPSRNLYKSLCREVTYIVDGGECHVVQSYKPSGHGYLRFQRFGVLLHLHRFVFEKYYGPIPEGSCVMHLCDNRMCINPNHLALGSVADNIRDMWRKGRGHKLPASPGQSNTQAKLTEEQVRFIRSSGEPGVALAKRFGVSKAQISSIRKRRTWRHV